MSIEKSLTVPLAAHQHLSQITLDIWSSILNYLPFKSVMQLIETGDTRIQPVRRALQHLELNRLQIRFKPFPTSFLCSWSGLHSLSISVTDDIYDSLPDSLSLPTSIRSLTVSVSDLNFLKLFSVLRDSYTSEVNLQPTLTELTINRFENRRFQLSLSMEDAEILGRLIQLLPLASLTCELSVHASIMSYLPATMIHLRMPIYGTKTESFPTPILPSHLLTLNLRAFNSWEVSWQSPLIIPASVTDLELTTTDKSVWKTLPPGLCSLSIFGSELVDEESVARLPRTLTSLKMTNYFAVHLLPHLPPSLHTLHRSRTAPTRSIDPSLLPSSLTRLNMYSFSMGCDWKHLPRGLQWISEEHLSIEEPSDFAFVADLPPSLLELNFQVSPTSAVLRSIPSRKVLKSLAIDHYATPFDLEFLWAFVLPTADDYDDDDHGDDDHGDDDHGDDHGVFASLENLDVSVLHFDVACMPNVYLPSLTSLNLRRNNFDDLASLPLHSPLKQLSLWSYDVDPSEPHRPRLKSVFFSSLPRTTLTLLELSDILIDTSESTLELLPPSLTSLSFSALVQDFSFKHFAKLPNSIQTLAFTLTSEEKEKEEIITSSLKDILVSLPRSIRYVSCSTASIIPLKLALDDCRGPPEVENALRLQIFLEHTPPFLTTLAPYFIDPNRIFSKAKRIMEQHSTSLSPAKTEK